jgi:hypothetical protein
VVIAALLAFLFGGSGQAFQAVACPSHDGSHAAVQDGSGLDNSGPDASETGSSEHHGVTHGSTPLDDAGSPPEHEGHHCTCLGTCCGSPSAEGSAPQGLARRLDLSAPAALRPAASALPAASESSYLLPFANAPPTSI